MGSYTSMTRNKYSIIDTDSHLSEPADLWTSRMSKAKWGDDIPRVVFDERNKMDRWLIGGKLMTGVAGFASAGWTDYPPGFPPKMEQADPAAWDPKARLSLMDEYGIYSQVLYPNLLAFMLYAFQRTDNPELVLECVRVYNDFLIEFGDADPDRFIALAVLPFWDVPEAVKELERAHEIGHRGLLFIGKPQKLGLPPLEDPHWDPIFKAAAERELSLNFHVGFSEYSEEETKGTLSKGTSRIEYARLTAMSHLGAAETMSYLVMSGVCLRHPDLKMVIVESGVGWVRYMLEVLDWQWINSGAGAANPERELPSFYFKRQVYGTFWFEQESMSRIVDLYPDNMMFETDFPHPTSLSPGPVSIALTPAETVKQSLAGVSDELLSKLLYDNAAKLYHVRGPQ